MDGDGGDNGGGGGGGGQWAPHGRQLTAGLVLLNVFVVGLIYYYLWRFFTGKGDEARSENGDDDGDEAESPKAREERQAMERAITALPVFVVRIPTSGDGGGGGGGECAICIAELADGEEGRLLPRCGHRFHARCVDVWFHTHSTCPLCRAAVLPPPPPQPTTTTTAPPPDTNTDRDANTHTDDCPV
uniref:RING-type E3 ubiquitin transferase n=1 Tax=Leersia perrieri TaxID=77586 RepID=A0A0D9WFL0_9ORYZ